VLCLDLAQSHALVTPLFIRAGLYWESIELEWLTRFLSEVGSPFVEPVVTLDDPIARVYGEHWSTTGRNVPDAAAAWDSVYLPGRNLLLVAKAAVWCQLHDRQAIALGCLQANPFQDSSAAFFDSLQNTLNLALGHAPKILLPYGDLRKQDVVERGRRWPLHLTFSCIDPVAGQHCGRCTKCAERQRSFREAGVPDLTVYAA